MEGWAPYGSSSCSQWVQSSLGHSLLLFKMDANSYPWVKLICLIFIFTKHKTNTLQKLRGPDPDPLIAVPKSSRWTVATALQYIHYLDH